MGKVINILDKTFKNMEDLSSYCISLLEKQQQLQKEIDTLQTLLAQTAPLISDKNIETQICEQQLYYLQNLSKERELTLEETKRLDILVKNLYLSKSKPTEITEFKNLNLTQEELIEIARN